MSDPTPARDRFPIVGVGASAGGIEAPRDLLADLPEAPGVALVIVTHLSPDRVSLLPEIVRRYTPLDVAVAADGARIEANTVHVVAAGDLLSVEDGHLRVTRPGPANRERKPIDVFFGALAADQGRYVVGVILSGGDGDGTLGAKAIKEQGGLPIAQVSDGSAPKQPDMPDTAIWEAILSASRALEEEANAIRARVQSFITGVRSA